MPHFSQGHFATGSHFSIHFSVQLSVRLFSKRERERGKKQIKWLPRAKAKNEKSKLTYFEMQKTSMSSLPHPQGTRNTSWVFLPVLHSGSLGKSCLLSGNRRSPCSSTRFHQRLQKPETGPMSASCRHTCFLLLFLRHSRVYFLENHQV